MAGYSQSSSDRNGETTSDLSLDAARIGGRPRCLGVLVMVGLGSLRSSRTAWCVPIRADLLRVHTRASGKMAEKSTRLGYAVCFSSRPSSCRRRFLDYRRVGAAVIAWVAARRGRGQRHHEPHPALPALQWAQGRGLHAPGAGERKQEGRMDAERGPGQAHTRQRTAQGGSGARQSVKPVTSQMMKIIAPRRHLGGHRALWCIASLHLSP